VNDEGMKFDLHCSRRCFDEI